MQRQTAIVTRLIGDIAGIGIPSLFLKPSANYCRLCVSSASGSCKHRRAQNFLLSLVVAPSRSLRRRRAAVPGACMCVFAGAVRRLRGAEHLGSDHDVFALLTTCSRSWIYLSLDLLVINQ